MNSTTKTRMTYNSTVTLADGRIITNIERCKGHGYFTGKVLAGNVMSFGRMFKMADVKEIR